MKYFSKFNAIFIIIGFLLLFSYNSILSQWNIIEEGNNRYKVCFADINNGWIVGDRGSIRRTTNGGENWVVQTSGVTNTFSAVYFANLTTGWAIGSSGLIINTTDGGTNWSIQTSGTTNNLNSIYFSDNNTGWVVGNTGTILKTTDGGANWSTQTSGTTNTLRGIYFFDANTGWIAGNSGTILKTTNGGTNWISQTSGTTAILRDIYFSDINTGWTVGNSGNIRKTTDGGVSWSQQTSGITSILYGVSFADNNTGWTVGASGIVLNTIDGGTSWAAQSSGTTNTLLGVKCVNANTCWMVGNKGTIFKTTDAGANWISQMNGTANHLQGVHFLDNNSGWTVGDVGTIQKTTDSGVNWTIQTSGVTNLLNDVFFTDANNGIVVGSGGVVLKTTDGGTNWVAQTSGTTSALYKICFLDSNIGWFAGGNGTIGKTTDGGANWILLTSGTENALFGIYFIDENNGYSVGNFGTILKTTDGGTSWAAQSIGSTIHLRGVYFINMNTGWAVGGNGAIFITNDAGSTWTPQTGNPTNIYYSVYFTDVNNGWVIGGMGEILNTTNAGLNWNIIPSGTTVELYKVSFSDNYTGWTVGDFGYILKYSVENSLEAPVLLSPENNSTNQLNNLALIWQAVENGSFYSVQVSLTNNFEEPVVNENNIETTSYQINDLEFNTSYFWRVKANSQSGGTSDWSEVWSFTTGTFVQIGNGTTYNSQYEYPSGYSNNSGGVRQQFLILPEEIYEAGGNTGEITSLSFNVALINSGIAFQNYQIKLKNSSVSELSGIWDLDGFTTVYFNSSYSPVLGWNSHSFDEPFFWDGASSIIVEVCFNNMSATLNESTFWTECNFTSTRFFNIDNYDGVCSGEPMWSTLSNYRPNMLLSFDLPPVLPSILENPVNKSLCVSTTPFFNWTDSDGASIYSLQVSTDPDFYSMAFEITGITESQYQLTNLNLLSELTQYYWRVNASDAENVSYWSRISSFITEGELTSPTLYSPVFGSIELEQAQIFTWESLLGATGYHLQVALDDEFQNIICDSISSENQFLLYNLPLNTQIFWHVASQNECSLSSFSETWFFTTNNIPFAFGYNISNYGMAKGLVTFSLINPENIYLIDDQSGIENLYCGSWANNLWYAVNSGNNLITVNYLTGERTVIGNIGFEVEGMSYDIQSNTMFAICYVNGNSILNAIDLSTAVPSQIGVVGTGYFYG
nr:YCF48-related protein [Candidatus Kapabacteria bacterium]